MTQTEWLEIFRASAPLLAAVIAGGVAYKFGSMQAGIARQQADTAKAAADTAKNKLKLELFERRLAIYSAAQDAFTSLSYRGDKAEDADWKFRGAIQQVFWLFGDDVCDYLHKDLWALIVRIRQAQDLRDQTDNPEMKAHAIEQLRIARKEVFRQEQRLKELLAPYMKLEN